MTSFFFLFLYQKGHTLLVLYHLEKCLLYVSNSSGDGGSSNDFFLFFFFIMTGVLSVDVHLHNSTHIFFGITLLNKCSCNSNKSESKRLSGGCIYF